MSRLLQGNVEGLKRELKNRKIRGYSRMKKAELRKLLERTLQAEAEVDNKQMQIEKAGLSEDKAAKESSLGQPNRRDSVRVPARACHTSQQVETPTWWPVCCARTAGVTVWPAQAASHTAARFGTGGPIWRKHLGAYSGLA